MSEHRYRCGACGRSRPASDTTLTKGEVGGNWRRASQTRRRRVCRECVQERVDQCYQYGWNLRERGFDWATAADRLGIDITGLYRDTFDRARAYREVRS